MSNVSQALHYQYQDARRRLDELAKAVATMRDLQRQYFRGNKLVLDQCKAAERRVDQLVAEAVNTDPQPRLF